MKKLLLLFAIPILAWSQVTVIQSPTPQFRSFLPSGAPNASGCVYTFTTGTSTPQATYTDFTGNTPNTNPVILDGTGSANIWISGAVYRIQVWSFGSGTVGSNCGNGTQLYQVDGVKDSGLNAFGTGPITVSAISNGIDIFTMIRATDVSPTGNFLNLKSFAGVSLFKVDILGNATATSVTTPTLSVTGTTTLATTNTTGSVNIKGPSPWYDVTQNGLACNYSGTPGSGTDDTTPLQTLVNNICTSPGAGLIFIPVGKACRVTASITIPCEAAFVGEVANGGAFGAGSFIVGDYTDATPTRGMLNWTGNNFLTQGVGGGIQHLVLWRTTGNTGGTGISLTATDCNHRPSHLTFLDVRITGDATGTWNHGMFIDGTACATSGTQGIRDIALINVQPFQTTTDSFLWKNCVHCYWYGATTSPSGGGIADVIIDGGGTALTNSTDVILSGSIFGNLTVNNAANVLCAGCYVSGTLSSTANTTQSVFTGFAGAYSLVNGLSVFSYDNSSSASQNAGFVNAMRSQNYLVAGPAAPSNIVQGVINANRSATGGDLCMGSDGNNCFRRNNGSGAGTNVALSFDAFATTPLQMDNVNGLALTVPLAFAHTLFAATAPTISTHFNTSGDSILTNGTGSFTITVGTGTATNSGALTMPTAATGWNCWLWNQSRADIIQQTASTTTSVTFTNLGTAFSNTNWTNGDTLKGGCTAN